MKFSALFQRLVLVFILSSIFYILLSPAQVLAESGTKSIQTSVPVSSNVDPDVPDNLHNWTQNVMIEVMSALSCQLTGIDPTNPNQQCLGVDQKTGKIGFYQTTDLENGKVGGAIGVVENGISVLFNFPVHTSDYVQNLAQNFGVTKKTYAQTTSPGTGFEGLKPVLGLWTAFRNIVYLIFVIVFVVIGLAIMLRIKIDPRTVMTIQNQIPKIIVGILLVTFSYAISGFLVDMMYVSTHVVGNIIITADPKLKGLPTNLTNDTNPFQAVGHVGAGGGNAATGIWSIVFSPAKAIGTTITHFFKPYINFVSGAFLGGDFSLSSPKDWFTGRVFFGAASKILSKAMQFIWASIFGALAFLVIGIALLIALFRLWFALLFAYISILIDVVLAPFWIIGSLIPGSPINVGGWLRHLIANLAAFPATIAMFLLGKVFMDAFGKGDFKTYFVPPLIGDRIHPEAVGSLIGLGIILMTPNIINMLKSALKVPKIDTGSIGASLKAGVGVPLGGFKTAAGAIASSKYDPITGKKFEGETATAGRFGRLVTRFLR